MKHYYHPMSRAVTTRWMLLELGVECEQVVVDFMAGDNLLPEFTDINPMAKVPALVDGDVVVTETAAICAYLADKFLSKGFAPAIDAPERGRYYRYLFVPGTTLEPMFSLNQMELPDYSPQSVGWGDLDRCLANIESMTPESDWVMDKQFTAADVVYGGTLDFACQFGWLDATPRIANYVQRLKNRPAYRDSHDPSWYQ